MKKTIQDLISEYEGMIKSNRERQIPMETTQITPNTSINHLKDGSIYLNNEWNELQNEISIYNQFIEQLKEVH